MSTRSALCFVALALLLAYCQPAGARKHRQHDGSQDDQQSREQAQLQAQIAAQERQNQQGLEQQGIADEWQSQQDGGRKKRRHGGGGGDGGSSWDGSGSQGAWDGSQGGSDGSQDGSDGGDWTQQLSKRERRRAKKKAREAGQSLDEYLQEHASQYGHGGRRSGGRRGGSSWGADNPEVSSGGRKRHGRGGGVRATYHYYSPAYETSSLYCADAFARRSGRELLRRPWMAYCVGGGAAGKCGKCARVTNLATGHSTVMMIVDQCGTGGVDMDPIGFNAIDGDGAGVRDGHMMVSVELCGC